MSEGTTQSHEKPIQPKAIKPTLDSFIGSRVRQLRKLKDLNVLEVGERCGVSGSKVWRWESGLGVPSISELNRVALVLGGEPEYFLRATPVGQRRKPSGYPIGHRGALPVFHKGFPKGVRRLRGLATDTKRLLRLLRKAKGWHVGFSVVMDAYIVFVRRKENKCRYGFPLGNAATFPHLEGLCEFALYTLRADAPQVLNPPIEPPAIGSLIRLNGLKGWFRVVKPEDEPLDGKVFFSRLDGPGIYQAPLKSIEDITS